MFRGLGRSGEALELHRRAVEFNLRTRSAAHPYIPYSLYRSGLALEGLGRLEEAAVDFERAVAIRSQESGRRFLAELPEARLALARVVLALGQRERALELGRAALADYGEAPEHDEGRGEARGFLRTARKQRGPKGPSQNK